MNTKVIDKNRFNLSDEQPKRFSYEMVFLPKEEKEDVDLLQALERNNLEWNRRLADERQAAVQQGYESGFEDGVQDAKTKIAEQLSTLEHAFEDLKLRLDIWKQQVAPGIANLVFELTRKVVGLPVESDELTQKISKEIEEFLDELTQDAQAKIIVSEQDYESIQALAERKKTNETPIIIDMNPSLLPGEYRIETNYEVLQRSYNKRLEDFKKLAGLNH